MSEFGRETKTQAVVEAATADPSSHFFVEGRKDFYVGQIAENGGGQSYQHADGAPVETRSPLGYNVGFWTATFLNVSMLIGTGIFSTPAGILRGTGSVGLSLIFWVLGWLISLSGISVYLELTSYFPSRSGAEVVYLEQAFPRPKYFFPVAFAFQTIVLSFNSSNAIVLAGYIFRMTDYTPSDWQTKGVAIAGFTIAILPVVFSTGFSLKVANVLGVVKVLTLLFITITGFVVLGGNFSKDKVADPHSNFKNAFNGTSSDAYNISNALVNIIFSYGGYTNSFNLANEVKNPVRTIKHSATLAVSVVFVLYFLVNIAYFAAIPEIDIIASNQVTATLFFSRLFGSKAAKGLTILPVFSAAGNIMTVVIGHARMMRETGRQGVVPFSKFWISTRPFGTPLGPVLFIWGITIVMIVAPPAGSAFNFIVALSNYPSSFFLALMTIGLFFIRRQRKALGLPRTEYRSWTFVAVFFTLVNVFLIVMPWVPPKAGINASAFGFFYAASSLTGLGLIGACGVYYLLWIKLLPKWGRYHIRPSILRLDDGAIAHQLVKVPNAEVERWDREHDPAGASINGESGASSVTSDELDDQKEKY